MELKEKPILFSGPMVRAILDGRKTQTRRVCKLDIPEDADEVFVWPAVKPMEHHANPGLWARKNQSSDNATDGWLRFLGPSPHGMRGDRLWVRETWAPCSTFDASEESGAIYREDNWRNGCEPNAKWRPSIHMPRWASRITLEVTGVRVERLQDISEADARAEGLPVHVVEHTFRKCYRDDSGRAARRIKCFQDLWDSIASPEHSWAANPWVWVYEFRRAER